MKAFKQLHFVKEKIGKAQHFVTKKFNKVI